MGIREIIVLFNQMQAAGVIERYAIGGAVGATFYLEPISTLDIDVFVPLKPFQGNLLISPQAIYDYLKNHGGEVQGEYIMVGGWPVQFLPPPSPLVEEALVAAVTFDLEGVPAQVISAENLAAIALQTGRAKDKARLLQFIESGVLDMLRFQDIIARHGMASAWALFRKNFLGEQT